MKVILTAFSLLFSTMTFLHCSEPITIHEAVAQGNISAVQMFLDRDSASVNQCDKDGNTPLHIATNGGRKALFFQLFPHGLSSLNNIEEINRASSLTYEILKKQVDIVHLLLNHGAAVNFQNNEGLTPLHEAAANVSECTVSFLLSHKVLVDQQNKDQSSLFTAALERDDRICRLLLANGALTNKQDNFGCTPLHYAAGACSQSFIDLLLAHVPSIIPNNTDEYPWDWAKSSHCVWIAWQIRHTAAKLEFLKIMGNPKNSAAILSPPLVQEILEYLSPEDFALLDH